MGVRIRSRVVKGDESGATLVIVALLLVALLGMVVLVLDVGGLLVKRRYMVQAADAAALAAAESCAVAPGTVLGNGQPAGDPKTEALTYSRSQGQNPDATVVPGAGADSYGIVAASTVGCQTSSKGHVTVSYTTQQSLFFAGIFGYGPSGSVGARATATWGPLGSGNAVPIVLELGQLQGPCNIPDPLAINKPCAFWYNNNDFGNATWGFMNLDKWNVLPGDHCSNAGSSSRSGWIATGYPDPLPLNGTPPGTAPTYVCNDRGHSSRDWKDLAAEEGHIKLFPVNDCAGQLPPCPATPDKYDIVGFTSLLVEHVYMGNDPLAIGSFGALGTCALTLPTLNNGTTTLTSILSTTPNTKGCPTTAPPVSGITNVTVSYPKPKTAVTCGTTAPCLYNTSTGVLTWSGGTKANASITFKWAFSDTAGACGTRPSDPNAICLVTVYKGFVTSSGIIGGTDFGARTIRLCELPPEVTVSTCPN